MTGQPDGVPWPTASWPVGEAPPEASAVVAELMAQPPELGLTLAVAVVHRGRLVAEAYGPETTADTTLISWSTAKSVTHALVGLLVGDGRLQLHEPAPVAAWEGDERSADHLAAPARDAAGPAVRRGVRGRRGIGRDRDALRRRPGRRRRVRRRLPARPRAGHRVELLVRHHEHRRPHCRRRGRRRGRQHALLPPGPAVRSARHGECLAPLRRCRHLHRLLVPLRHRPGLRSLRVPLPARRHVGRRAAAARRVGRPRPSARASARQRRSSATARTGGCGGSTQVPSPPMGTRASTSSCSPTATSWWCGSARRRPS